MAEVSLTEAIDLAQRAHCNHNRQKAEEIYRSILNVYPDHPQINHNLGVLLFEHGYFLGAKSYFIKAIEKNPNVSQYWISLLKTTIILGDLVEVNLQFNRAEKCGLDINHVRSLRAYLNTNFNSIDPSPDLYRQLEQYYTARNFDGLFSLGEGLSQFYPRSAKVLNMIGAAYLRLNSLSAAEAKFTEAIKLDTKFTEAYNNLGIVYQNKGDDKGAKQIFETVIALNPLHAEAKNNLATINYYLDEFDLAIEHYLGAIKLRPHYTEAYFNLGILYNRIGKIAEAVQSYEKAIEIKPNYVEAYNKLGILLGSNVSIESALSKYSEAIDRFPNIELLYVNLLELLERMNELDLMQQWMERAVKNLGGQSSILKLIHCRLFIRTRLYRKAGALLETIDPTRLHGRDTSIYYELRAKNAEKQHLFQGAYKFYDAMNESVKSSEEFKKFNPKNFLAHKKRIACRLEESEFLKDLANVSSARNLETNEQKYFLVGFPRSGTTLLDTILRSHSKTQVIEEQPLLSTAINMVMGDNLKLFLDEFPEQTKCEKIKKLYSKLRSQHIAEDNVRNVIIDKLPLNLLATHQIAYLFPEARFLLAVRHPMDVILSNWTQNFKLNSAMASMFDMDDIVDYYCTSMNIFFETARLYDLQFHSVYYEALVSDMPKETTNLLAFLGIDWEDGVLDYQATAKQRGRINTPSYSQVTQPLYKSSIDRWKNYSDMFLPYKAKLNPWLEKFGYDLLQ